MILHITPAGISMEPLPLTRESILRAKMAQQAERLKAAREMGIPQDLIDMYEVFGFDQMATWTLLILALKQD